MASSVVWYSREGPIALESMSSTHIKRTLKLLKKSDYKKYNTKYYNRSTKSWIRLLRQELNKRIS